MTTASGGATARRMARVTLYHNRASRLVDYRQCRTKEKWAGEFSPAHLVSCRLRRALEVVTEAEADHARIENRGHFVDRRRRGVGRAHRRRHTRVQDVEDVEHRRHLAEPAEFNRLVDAEVENADARIAVRVDRL